MKHSVLTLFLLVSAACVFAEELPTILSPEQAMWNADVELMKRRTPPKSEQLPTQETPQILAPEQIMFPSFPSVSYYQPMPQIIYRQPVMRYATVYRPYPVWIPEPSHPEPTPRPTPTPAQVSDATPDDFGWHGQTDRLRLGEPIQIVTPFPTPTVDRQEEGRAKLAVLYQQRREIHKNIISNIFALTWRVLFGIGSLVFIIFGGRKLIRGFKSWEHTSFDLFL